MTSNSDKLYRKISRDFKGLVELAKRTPLEVLEKILVELYDNYVQNYIMTEREKHPEKTTKELIFEMNRFRENLKGKGNK